MQMTCPEREGGMELPDVDDDRGEKHESSM